LAITATKTESLAALPNVGQGVLSRIDLRNLGIVIAGFASVLILIPPARSYPMTDDWIYWQSVNQLTNLAYTPHDWSQATALGHVAWGAIFADVFGNTFTVLTMANMAMSMACLITVYLLLRELGVQSTPALLGVAVVGFNPVYVYLSYSFMTDVTFLFYMMVSCLFYIKGLRTGKLYWLWLGGLATGLAYLTRQYGVLVMVAVLALLWLSRRWTWRQAIAIAVLPAVSVVGYASWEHFQPTPIIAWQMESLHTVMFQDLLGWASNRLLRLTWAMQALGLALLPVLRLPKRPIRALSILAGMVCYEFLSVSTRGSVFPRNGNVVDQNGNVVDSTGFLMYSYNAQPIWNQGVWALLGILGALAFSLYMIFALEQIITWLRSRPWRRTERSLGPTFILYALAAMLAGVMVIATPFIFDRYWLAVLPILALPGLKRMGVAGASAMSARLRWLVVVPIAVFALVGMRDYKEHATVRWQAAQTLVSTGVQPEQIAAGFEWENWYEFAKGADYIRRTHDLQYINYPAWAVLDPIYAVSDIPLQDYTEIGALPYKSWLDGGVERRVLILMRK
jgi:4-amino-4-deoxy-L-arabinose transferase-like glycosyltransferase